jgi:hypothetical protein
MDKTLRVLFDGQVFRPDSPPGLEANTHYEITIHDLTAPEQAASETDLDSAQGAWEVLRRLAGTVDAPPDWSVALDRLPDQDPETQPDIDLDSAHGAWEVLRRLAGTVDAPPDWSLEHDHYLYGSPKRHTENQE